MDLRVRYQRLFDKVTVFFSTLIRFMLNALVLIISVALVAGVIKAGIYLFTHLDAPLEELMRHMLLDIVYIVALIEITLVILGYLKDGAVHVRYIVDTVLIIMLNKVVSFWFEGGSLQEAIGLSILILSLAIIRITTIRWGPDRDPATPKPD